MGLTDFLLRISNFLILLHGNVQLFVIYILCVENPFLHIGGNMVYYKQCSGTLLLQKAAELQNWAQWTHHAEGKTHCEECLKLDGCWFQEELFKLWRYAVEDIPWLKAEIERDNHWRNIYLAIIHWESLIKTVKESIYESSLNEEIRVSL